MKRIFGGLVVSLVFISSARNELCAADLITNGGFENTSGFVADGNDTMSLPSGSVVMDHWTSFSGELAWIGPNNPFNPTIAGALPAHSGDYFLDLTGYHDAAPFGGIQQTIATIAGSQYDLSFYLGAARDGESHVSVSVGGAFTDFGFSSIPGPDWQLETLHFTATGATTITFLGTQPSDGRTYIGLDDISVIQSPGSSIPEPSSFALLGLGGLSLALSAIRRFRGGSA